MPRIRTIKPEFPQSESMGRISRDARLIFILLWTLADDYGRLRGNSRMLGGLLLPYDEDSREVLPSCLDELEREGCIKRYTCNQGYEYVAVTNWESHQKIDKRSKSKLPSPPPPNPREDLADSAESSRTFGLGSKDLRIKDQGSKDQGSGGSKGEIAIPEQPPEQPPKQPPVQQANGFAIATIPSGPYVSISAKPPKPKKVFVKPTTEEVEAYCRERGNQVVAQNFVDHYTANGWRVGRNPMKDWKAAVRTWEQSHTRREHGGVQTFAERDRHNEKVGWLRIELERLGLSVEAAKRLAETMPADQAREQAKRIVAASKFNLITDKPDQ